MSTRSATTAGRYAKRADFQDYIWGSSLMINDACDIFFDDRNMPRETLADQSIRQYAANVRRLQMMDERRAA